MKNLSILLICLLLSFVACGGDDSDDGHTHTWGSDVITAATCVAAGYTTQTCSDCSATQKINPTAALGHNWNWTTYNSSTGNVSCTRVGCSGGFAEIGDTGPAGGIIIYVAASGFTVTGAGSFTAHYLEAAPTNQAVGITWSSTNVNVTGANGIEIGTGKANTAAIIAAYGTDTTANNAAKAVDITIGGKNDWFLPSLSEIQTMHQARTHLGMSGYFWSSTNVGMLYAYSHNCDTGYQTSEFKTNTYSVRAVRAF